MERRQFGERLKRWNSNALRLKLDDHFVNSPPVSGHTDRDAHNERYSCIWSAGQHGGRSCHVLLARVSSLPLPFASNSRPWSGPAPRPKPWSFAVASSCARPTTTGPTTSNIAGELDCDRHTVGQWRERFVGHWPRRPARRPTLRPTPELFPPTNSLAVVNLATSKTEDHDQPATRWSLDDLASPSSTRPITGP